MLKVTLFGNPQIQYNNTSLNGIVTGRNLALFIYLAMTNQPQERGHLADLLWTDIGEQEAKQNLRGVLYSLRKLLGDYLIVTRNTIAFDKQKVHWIDANVFSTCLADPQSFNDLALLQGVLNLYQGEFLADFYIQNAPAFEAWLLQQKQQFRSQYLEVLLSLSRRSLAQGDYATGLKATRRILHIEPWQEEAHRLQMCLLAYSGQRLEALNQYATCCQVLQEEYSVAPESATTQLFHAIENGELTPSPVAQQKKVNGVLQANWDEIPQNRSWIGRAAELDQLQEWIFDDRRRLIGLFGLAGQGKSALAAEVVAHLHDDVVAKSSNAKPNIDVVIWSSLTTVPSILHLLQQWLERLAQFEADKVAASVVPFASAVPSSATADMSGTIDLQLRRLLMQLRHRRVLLVIDAGDTICAGNSREDGYKSGWEAFDELLRRLAENEHCSSLLLISRIQPPTWKLLAHRCAAVRTLTLAGLPTKEGIALLQAGSKVSADPFAAVLIDRCAGHPQTLVAMHNLLSTFGSDLFLSTHADETVLEGTLFRSLRTHFNWLPALEQSILLRLALTAKPQMVASLWQVASNPGSMIAYLEALQTLQRHHLLLLTLPGEILMLPPLVERFLQQHLVEQLMQELTQNLALFADTIRHSPTRRQVSIEPILYLPSRLADSAKALPSVPALPNSLVAGQDPAQTIKSRGISFPIDYSQVKQLAYTFDYLCRYPLTALDASILPVLNMLAEHLVIRYGMAGAISAIQRLHELFASNLILAGRFGLENLSALTDVLQQQQTTLSNLANKETLESRQTMSFWTASPKTQTPSVWIEG